MYSEVSQAAVDNYWKVIFNWAQLYQPKDRGSKYAFQVALGKNDGSGKYWVSKAMLNTCKRHVLYMYKYYNEEDFKYEYSTDRVNFLLNWWETNLKLTEGTSSGKPFILEPNQAYKLSELYGWNKKRQPGDTLRFMINKIYDVETRKQGKSQFYAGLADFIVLNAFGSDAQPEIYIVGPKYDTSKLVYTKAQQMVLKNPQLASNFKATNTQNFLTRGNGLIKALPFSVDALEGHNPSFAIITEYHLHQSDDMVNSDESAANDIRPNKLTAFDTTKGVGINGVAHTRENQYKDLIKNQVEVNPFITTSENILGIFYEVDTNDDPDDILNPYETNPLRKSTPMLGVTVQLESLQKQWIEVRYNPVQRREFLIKKWGAWVGSLQGLITITDITNGYERWKDKWKSIDDLKGQPAVIGVDLAQSGDTNSVHLIFKANIEGRDILLGHNLTFIPRATMEERIYKEKLPYEKWVEDGFVRISGDKTVNYQDIADYIIYLTKTFKIENICYDPYQFGTVEYHLQTHGGVPTDYFKETPQGPKDLSAPMELFTKKILDYDYYDFGNQVSRTQILNVKPIVTSSGGSYFKKSGNTGKIDAFASGVTALTEFNDLRPLDSKQKSYVSVWNLGAK